jgi:hypothetical protein
MRIVRASNTTRQVRAKGEQVVMVPARLKDSELAQALGAYKDVKWLHVTRPVLTFGGFSEPVLQQEFDRAMSDVTTYWCCRSPAFQNSLGLPDRVPYRLRPLEQMSLVADITGREV